MQQLELRDCFLDSALFRARAMDRESALVALETQIGRTGRTYGHLAQASAEYAAQSTALANEIAGLLPSSQAAQRITGVLRDLERARAGLVGQQLADALVAPLEKYAGDIACVRRLSREFSAASNDHDAAHARYMGKKPRDAGIAESAAEAAGMRREMHGKSLAYAAKLNDASARRECVLEEAVLAAASAYYAFFHQGYEMLRELEPTLRELGARVDEMRSRNEKIPKPDLPAILASVKPEMYNPMIHVTPSAPEKPRKSGYLYKKSQTRVRNTWDRRFFELEGHKFGYYNIDKFEYQEIDLRVSMVREAVVPDRRNCLELVSPARTFLLQADNEKELHDWIACIQNGVGKALDKDEPPSEPQQVSASPETPTQDVVTLLKRVPGNDRCADCGSPDPEWASTNLGIVLCIACSGIHRGLGRHVSKVRSVTLDRWDSELLGVMSALGNQRVAAVFESTAAADARAAPSSDRPTRERWISRKYVERAFVQRGGEDPTAALEAAVRAGDVAAALSALARGADVNAARGNGATTALHAAASAGDVRMSEFLLQWGASADAADSAGRTAVFHAALANRPTLIALLVKRNARVDVRDASGKALVDVLLEKARDDAEYAKVLTMVRLVDLHGETNAAKHNELGINEMIETLSLEGIATRDKSPDVVVVDKIAIENPWDKSPPVAQPKVEDNAPERPASKFAQLHAGIGGHDFELEENWE